MYKKSDCIPVSWSEAGGFLTQAEAERNNCLKHPCACPHFLGVSIQLPKGKGREVAVTILYIAENLHEKLMFKHVIYSILLCPQEGCHFVA